MLKILVSVLLIIFANRCFNIGPWWHQKGVFDVAGIGNCIILGGIVFYFVFSKERKILLNPISILIGFHTLLICIHFWLAQINYNQSFVDSLIAVRHQFYFLSFFLFLFLLYTTENIIQLLNILVIIAIIVVVLSIINYSGIVIFHHKWAEGHGMREGITRAFIPGMGLISFCALWAFSKWTNTIENKKYSMVSSIILITSHFFRQTRMMLFGITGVIFGYLIIEKRWKQLFSIVVVISIAVLTLSIALKTNLITNNFYTAYVNFTEQKGSWESRGKQIKIDLQEFKKHPWIGNGLSAMREHGASWQQIKMRTKTFKADLGYSSWLKFFGLFGIVWLFMFFGFQIVMGLVAKARTKGDEKTLAVFAICFLVYTMGTFITLNHLMYPHEITLVTLNAAIITRLYMNSSGNNRITT